MPESKKTFLEEFFPEAEEVDRSLESIKNGLVEVSRMEQDLNANSTPDWIREKLKDELDEHIVNIKTNSSFALKAIQEITDSNNALNSNCVEHRIRKGQIAQLSCKLIELMNRCDRMQIDLQAPALSSRPRPSTKQSLTTSESNEARRFRVSKSVDELRGAFADVASKLSIPNLNNQVSAIKYNVNEGRLSYSAVDAMSDYTTRISTRMRILMLLCMFLLTALTYSFYFL